MIREKLILQSSKNVFETRYYKVSKLALNIIMIQYYTFYMKNEIKAEKYIDIKNPYCYKKPLNGQDEDIGTKIVNSMNEIIYPFFFFIFE
jgi:hypothetical protein